MNADDPVAIDVHAHAGEPCRGPRDDYYRERRIGAAIFPVGAERETGFRRHSNEEVARVAAENAGIPSPFAAIDPAKGRAGWCARSP